MTTRLSASRRQIALRLSTEQGAHLDERAAFWVCSRAAYIRRLLQEDLKRQQQSNAAAQG